MTSREERRKLQNKETGDNRNTDHPMAVEGPKRDLWGHRNPQLDPGVEMLQVVLVPNQLELYLLRSQNRQVENRRHLIHM